MEKLEILPKGKVFVTESMNAQPGLNLPTKNIGVYSDFDPKNLPDKTDGEKIAESKEAYRKSIQREAKAKREWEVMSKSKYRSISDDFSSELEKLLKK